MSRLLKDYENQITQPYKKGKHNGIDIVGYKSKTCYLLAHSDGVVVGCRNNYNKTDKTGNSYGNYVKIKHDNGYYTMYGHIKYNTVQVKVNQRVNKGDVIGYMGNTGHSYGAHLHWEVRNEKDLRIDPTPYLESNLPVNKYNLTRVLKKGCKGADVKELQKTLIGLGYSCGNYGADGSFGNDTLTAVKKFQKANKLVADGVVGKNTAHALGWLYKGK